MDSAGPCPWWTVDDRSRSTHWSALELRVLLSAAARLRVDGRRTRTENIADLGGLAAAFDAYRATLGDAGDRASVRRHDREFFIGFARSWRGKAREEALRTLVATDSHAPERDRIATVRNIDAWYDAFDVRPGQRLYLEPGARVRIW